MKSVYSSPLLFWVEYYKDILQSKGISTHIKNEYLAGGAGELPPNECWPILYVNDEDYILAKSIVDKELSSENVSFPSWTCTQCNEINEGQFAVCWKCGASSPGQIMTEK